MQYKIHYHLLFLPFLLVLTSISAAQTLSIDTIKVYDFTGSSGLIQGTDTICTIDNKSVTYAVYKKVMDSNKPLLRSQKEREGKLLFVYSYDLNDVLLFTTYMISVEERNFGPYKEYYSNGKLKVKGQYLDAIGYLKSEHGCMIKNGEWTFFNEDGSVDNIEYWENDKLIRAATKTKH